MTMGVSECQADLFGGTGFVGDRVEPGSIFALLFGEGDRLFPDSMFADLFSGRGRRSTAPRTVATVMVLQRWFGLSDREAVAAFEFDVRWRYACGGLALDSGGFCHTVLVGMRARLAASRSPRRIFDVVLDAARAAGAVSPRRVLDSAPIYDAVATQDTVTMLRSAIRQTLAAADAAGLGPRLRAVLRRDDDYASGGKAVCDWEDPAAREALVAELAEDASAVLEAMRGRALGADAADAAELLAAVSGQDLEAGPDNRMRIARRVAEDRVISTTDPDARHGRKSTAGGFDADARARQRDPAWKHDYRAVRPKVERKLAHLKRRWHGGRRARVRGRPKVDADFNLLAAAVNLARLAALGLHSQPQKWALA